MDGEADGASPREAQNSCVNVLMEVKDLQLDAEECSSKSSHKVDQIRQLQCHAAESNGSPNNQTHTGNSGSDSEPDWTESSCLLPAPPVHASQDRCIFTGEEERSPTLEHWLCLDHQHNMVDIIGAVGPPVLRVSDDTYLSLPSPESEPADVSPDGRSLITDTCSPSASSCGVTASDWDFLRSTPKSPLSWDQYPVSAAAHLHLLGESLSLIGGHLQETNKTVCVSSSLSLLLDSLLCSLTPLMCLTTQIPELASCTEHTLASVLENIAYVMPGL